MEWGKKAVADGSDLEARAQVQWASIVALNGWVQAGVYMLPPVHMIEHALSPPTTISRTGRDWPQSTRPWMRFAAKARPERFAQFSRRVLGMSQKDKDDLGLAMEGIDRFEDFLRSIGCPTRLSELGIGDELFSRYAEDAMLVLHDENGNLLGRPPMSKKGIVEVLKSAL